MKVARVAPGLPRGEAVTVTVPSALPHVLLLLLLLAKWRDSSFHN